MRRKKRGQQDHLPGREKFFIAVRLPVWTPERTRTDTKCNEIRRILFDNIMTKSEEFYLPNSTKSRFPARKHKTSESIGKWPPQQYQWNTEVTYLPPHWNLGMSILRLKRWSSADKRRVQIKDMCLGMHEGQLKGKRTTTYHKLFQLLEPGLPCHVVRINSRPFKSNVRQFFGSVECHGCGSGLSRGDNFVLPSLSWNWEVGDKGWVRTNRAKWNGSFPWPETELTPGSERGIFFVSAMRVKCR